MNIKLKRKKRALDYKKLQMFFSVAIVATVMIFSLPGQSKAKPAHSDGGWDFAAEVYFWGASIGGDTATGTDVDIEIDDLIDGLNMAFMGSFGVKKERWAFMVDAIYLDSSDNTNINTRIGGVNTNVDLSSWIVTPMIGYEVLNSDKFSLTILGGVRYLYLDTEIDLRNADPAGPAFSFNGDDSGDNWDGIIGIMGDIEIAANWYIPYHLDIGTGDSEFTWQGFTGIGYHFNHIDVLAGYRYLSWNFDDNDVFDDMNLSGFMAGAKFYF
ncbi:MAG: hypothetical protein ACI8PB_003327 [Desulforhopalus sp.]|jgi:hypothetical protein